MTLFTRGRWTLAKLLYLLGVHRCWGTSKHKFDTFMAVWKWAMGHSGAWQPIWTWQTAGDTAGGGYWVETFARHLFIASSGRLGACSYDCYLHLDFLLSTRSLADLRLGNGVNLLGIESSAAIVMFLFPLSNHQLRYARLWVGRQRIINCQFLSPAPGHLFHYLDSTKPRHAATPVADIVGV